MDNQLVVGVDVGGTKTHIRVTRLGSRQEIERVVPTRDWRHRDNVADAASFVGLLDQVCEGQVCAAFGIGAHGCDSEADCDAFERSLQALTGRPVRVVNDAELIVPAAGSVNGIGLVAGTGSIAVGRRADNGMLVAGGWGWILGDEGSASGLVREAVKAVRGAIDADQPREALYEALCRSLGARSETEFGRKLEAVRGAAGWGSHAKAVFEAAAAGSDLAHRVIADGARGLALLVRRVTDRGGDPAHVVAAGGVIVAQPLLYELFVRELHDAVPEAVPSLLRVAPVGGAVLIAERLALRTIAPVERARGGEQVSGPPSLNGSFP